MNAKQAIEELQKEVIELRHLRGCRILHLPSHISLWIPAVREPRDSRL